MTMQTRSEFTVPRTTLEAWLFLAQGEAWQGIIFLVPRTPLHTGGETPLAMLNRREPVFPFRTRDDGTVLLVTKAQTMRLTTARDPPSDADPYDVPNSVAVEVTLADRSTISGTVTMEVPAGRSRLLDYLNDVPDPFFAVSDGTTTHYVNRNHVLYVRPTKE